MSDGAHLLIPFAFSDGEPFKQALPRLALPNFDEAMSRLAAGAADRGDEHSLSMPHERALARVLGLAGSDGLIALAAHEAAIAQPAASDIAAAWITPCHWRVGMDHIDMDDPAALQLEEGESRAFLEAMRPFFEEDGIALAYEAPTRWLAHGEIFREMPVASLDRVRGRTIAPWLQAGAARSPIRRLQQEMQMLLYTHPANDERAARGLLPVNSFWVSATGALPAGFRAQAPAGLRMPGELRAPALQGDAQGWMRAWQAIDARDGAWLLSQLKAGEPVTLTLCGERSAQAFEPQAAGFMSTLRRAFSKPRLASALADL